MMMNLPLSHLQTSTTRYAPATEILAYKPLLHKQWTGFAGSYTEAPEDPSVTFKDQLLMRFCGCSIMLLAVRRHLTKKPIPYQRSIIVALCALQILLQLRPWRT